MLWLLQGRSAFPRPLLVGGSSSLLGWGDNGKCAWAGITISNPSGNQIGWRKSPYRGRAYPLRRLPVGAGPEGQPAGYYWARTPFSASDLLNWESSSPSYRDGPTKMTDLAASIFATHHPNWADMQALLNILLVRDEQRLVLDKANEEARTIHRENPDGAPNPTRAIPLTEPNWDPNRDGLPLLEHYKRCILERMGRGGPQAEKSEYGTGGATKVHRGPFWVSWKNPPGL